VTVIAVSLFESVVRDHSKDHPMAVAHSRSDTLTGIPYTTLLDATRTASPSSLWQRLPLARGFHRRVAWVRVDQLKGALGQRGCDLSMATFVRVEEHLSGEEA
jgi:hypothetical protein